VHTVHETLAFRASAGMRGPSGFPTAPSTYL
jgi:hypothetical protein